jgi:uncharacterized protein YfaS (alpha-2-macroglobulin family)
LWEPGDYALVAKATPGRGDARGDYVDELPVQWFIFTDIGLSYLASSDKLYVVARSLRSGEPRAGTKIQLLAANNRILAEQRTDDKGVARFDGRLARGSHGNKLVAILAYEDGTSGAPSDFSYVDLVRDALDLSRAGVSGRAPAGALDAMIYTDRGAYRPDPDQPVRGTVIVRDAAGNVPAPLGALRVQLRSGHGNVLGSPVDIKAEDLEPQFGGHTVALTIPSTAPLGTAYVEALAEGGSQPIGRATIQIAHVRPDRVRLMLGSQADWKTEMPAAGPLTIRGRAVAQHLHGRKAARGETLEAPVVGASGEVEIVVEPAKGLTGRDLNGCYRGFEFGLHNDSFVPHLVRSTIGPSDPDGSLDIVASIAGLARTLRPLQARISVSLLDAAGTMAAQTVEIPIENPEPMIGVRARSTSIAADRFDAIIEVAALTAQLTPRPNARLGYRLIRERTEFVWQLSAGSWTYRPDFGHESVKSGEFSTSGVRDNVCQTGNGRVPLAGLSAGSYVIEIYDGQEIRASARFVLGATNQDATRPEPNLVNIYGIGRAEEGRDIDFASGKPAQFKIETPFDGSVLAAVVDGGEVRDWISAQAVGRTAELTIDPVPDAWAGRGMHLLVSVFRKSADGSEAHGPARAIGVLPFTVERERNHLKVDLRDTPYQVTPTSGLPVLINAEDGRGARFNGKAMVAVYAVDEGLINLTNHPVPQPFQHFYGRRRLAFDIHDSYTRLLLRREGGDSTIVERLIFNNYLSDQIVAVAEAKEVKFEGGVASISIPAHHLEKFSGTVRLAAVVWTAEAIGADSKDVVVRDALIADLGLPRFLAPGDRPTLPLALENVDALDDDYIVKVAGAGIERVTMPGRPAAEDLREHVRVRLSRRERKQILLHMHVPEAESALPISIEIRGADSARNPLAVTRNWTIKVRQPFVPVVSQLKQEKLAPNASLGLAVPGLAQSPVKWRSVQARFTTSAFPVPVALPDAQLGEEVQNSERLAWSALLLLHQERGGARSKMLDRVLADLVALQHRSGGFFAHRLGLSATGRETKRRIASPDVAPKDAEFDRDLWRAAFATDVLRLGRVANRRHDQALAAAVQFLKREASSSMVSSASIDGRESSIRTAKPATDDAPLNTDDTIGDVDSVQGSLPAEIAEVPQERAQQLGLKPGSGALVVRSLSEARGAAGELIGGDVIVSMNDRDVLSHWDLQAHVRAMRPESKVKLKVVRNRQVVELQVVLREVPPTADSDSRCTSELAYAAYVLVRLDLIDLTDLNQFGEACSSREAMTEHSPLAQLILAAAFKEFGKLDRAQTLLASFRSSQKGKFTPPPDADRLEYLAQVLTFLDRAAPGAPEIVDVLREIEALLGRREPISLAANAWLARAALERATQSMVHIQPVPEQIDGRSIVDHQSGHEVATRFIEERDLPGVTLTNRSNTAVFASLFLRGVPKAPAGASAPFTVSRRYFRADGSELTGQELAVDHNELLFVVLEGGRLDGSSSDDDPILIVDLIPAGFEILHGDVYQEDDATRLLPESRGDVDHVELRDDRYIAVVRGSEFRAAYAVRATTTGQFRVAQVRVEELRRPELGADALEERSVTIRPK